MSHDFSFFDKNLKALEKYNRIRGITLSICTGTLLVSVAGLFTSNIVLAGVPLVVACLLLIFDRSIQEKYELNLQEMIDLLNQPNKKASAESLPDKDEKVSNTD